MRLFVSAKTFNQTAENDTALGVPRGKLEASEFKAAHAYRQRQKGIRFLTFLRHWNLQRISTTTACAEFRSTPRPTRSGAAVFHQRLSSHPSGRACLKPTSARNSRNREQRLIPCESLRLRPSGHSAALPPTYQPSGPSARLILRSSVLHNTAPER